MASARIRYELRVGTHVGAAALATFQVPVQPVAVPRRTLYRFCVPADRDIADTLDRLIASEVEVLEIRRCLRPSAVDRPSTPARLDGPPPDEGGPAPTEGGGVVLAFPGAAGRRLSGPAG